MNKCGGFPDINVLPSPTKANMHISLLRALSEHATKDLEVAFKPAGSKVCPLAQKSVHRCCYLVIIVKTTATLLISQSILVSTYVGRLL